MNRALRCCVAVACAAAAAERGGCRRKPMLWLHVHNAGGTSLRLHAEANGEKPLEPATHNWNLAFDKDRTCREKAELLAEQPEASFTFVERPLERSDVGCAEFAYGLTLRRPLDTARSTLRNNDVDAAERYAAHALGYFDNFLVRTLNGGKVFREVAVGALNASHVDVAARVLEDRFDVVLKLEDSLDVGPPQARLGPGPRRDGARQRPQPPAAAQEPEGGRAAPGDSGAAHGADRSSTACGEPADPCVAPRDGPRRDALIEAFARFPGPCRRTRPARAARQRREPRRRASEARAPPGAALRALGLGFDDASEKSLYDAACARGFVALFGHERCNVGAAPAELRAAHDAVRGLVAEASWAADVPGRPFQMRGLCLAGPRRGRAAHCAADAWVGDLRRAVDACLDAGAEALFGPPFGAAAAQILDRAPDAVALHGLVAPEAWAAAKGDARAARSAAATRHDDPLRLGHLRADQGRKRVIQRRFNARTELWPAKEREALLGAVAPYPHVVVLDSLPPGSNSTQPRDFATADLLRIAGVDPGEPDLAVHTMVDADDALHPDAMLHLRAAAAGATSPASPAAVICSAAAHEWRPERDRACRSGAVTLHVQSELCVTPGFTMATRLDHANETLGVRHVETRRGGDWHNRTVHVKNATPLRARTVTSHGAKHLADAGVPAGAACAAALSKARALGFFGAWHARQKLSEAADVVLKSEKAVVADQLHARCQDGFSCKHTKQADLASYLKSGDAAPKAPHHTMGRRRRRKRDEKRERSEEQRAAAAATLGEAGATVADRVAALAAATQCAAAADVPMPCPDPKATPLFAVHVPKTGGRALWTAVERASGQHLCDWAPMRFGHYRSSLGFDAKTSTRSPKGPPDFGDAARFEAAVAGRARDLRKKPCLTTYETSFRSVRAFGDATPAVVTMVREPTAWRRSVVAHGAERGRHGDLDALFAAGCLGADSCDLYADAHYLLYGIRRPTQALLLSAEGDYPAVGAPEPAGSLAEARAHLDGAVFGLTDHFALSECLFQFQFRGKLAKKDCDCGTGRVFGSDARTYASAPDAKNASDAALAALDALKAGDDADYYAYAEALFFSRVRVAENATGVRLVCD
ncbi:rhamnosyl transferase [Aureococcus anophagefferens]|nr:rhamnosyl transferase [Aureococcus anophagefferens]